mmetsp:Transcript_25415/g.71274  ORF Transcript_25415/g.71274 Transcript_25415/m.71274 type:complete len:251 (-) Transcript_25415:404-1156(-)
MWHFTGRQGKARAIRIPRVMKMKTRAAGSASLRALLVTSRRRKRLAQRCSRVKAVAARPHTAPTTTAGRNAMTWVEITRATSKTTVLGWEKSPKWPSVKPTSTDLKELSEKTAHMQAKKICQPSFCCQKEATSSKAKSSPPMGALKAVATPAATPAVMKSRFSLPPRNRRKSCRSKPSAVECAWLRPAPMMAPMWIMGPSGPTGRPLATASTQLASLATKVRRLRMPRRLHPLRYAITSGTPDPAARGAP